jgi:meiotic recombination protein SPO11
MPPESATGLWGEDDLDRREEEEAGEGFDFADFADDELTPEETAARIEALAAAHALGVLGLGDGDEGADYDRVPPAALELSILGREGGVLAADASERSTLAFRVPAGAVARVRLHDPRRPLAYARIWKMLRALHAHLSEHRTVTQRGLYYLLATSDKTLFPTPAAVNRCLARDCVGLLRCTRRAMGVTAAGRGQVAGSLQIRGPEGRWRDLSLPGAGHFDVPGDIAAVEHPDVEFRSDAKYLLVVEKDAVFAKLANERVWDRLPMVLVTAKGFPDLATRAFLRRLARRFPEARALALVDWNPSGLLILQTYRSGSGGAALEAGRYALDVGWLGVRCADLRDVPEAARLPLTDLDRAKIRNMLAVAGAGDFDDDDGGGDGAGERRARVFELREMRRTGRKAEIESLYPIEGEGAETLSDYVVGKIVAGDYF